jgi:hypothetical protein
MYGPQVELRLRARGPRMAPNYFDSMNRLAGELLGTRPGHGPRNTVRSRDARMVGFLERGVTS